MPARLDAAWQLQFSVVPRFRVRLGAESRMYMERRSEKQSGAPLHPASDLSRLCTPEHPPRPPVAPFPDGTREPPSLSEKEPVASVQRPESTSPQSLVSRRQRPE